MASYPINSSKRGSGDPQPLNSIDIDRAEDGSARARSFHSTDRVKFSLEHPWLTSAEKTILSDFYTANRLLAFDYTSISSGATHSCLFSKPPAYEFHRSGFWTAKVEIEEV